MQDLSALFNSKEANEQMIQRLADNLTLEQTKEEIYKYFKTQICKEMADDNIISAWAKYKEDHV